jgi:HTH-type transcriptional regulator/antitoxin HigA
VCAFLGISSIHETPPLLAHFRHGQVEAPNVSTQIAWVRRVQQLGRQQQAARLDRERLHAYLSELLRYMPEVEQLSRIPTLLNELGVRFVIVRHLPKTYIDGVVCDLDRHEPIIGLTLRYDRVDAFWFTLLHELAHIVLGHARFHLDNIDDQELNKQRQEQEANEQARNWLIDQGALAGFIARTRPFYARTKILRFAAQQQTHPGIVVGQLHYRQELPYTNLRALLVKVSPYLAQSVDGDRLREQSDETEGSE